MKSSNLRSRAAPLAGFGLLLAACASEVDAPSVYSGQKFLCDDPEALEAAVAECRADHDRDGSCAGIFSLEGDIEGHDVVIASRADRSGFTDSTTLADTPLSVLHLAGNTPYFRYLVDLSFETDGTRKLGTCVVPNRAQLALEVRGGTGQAALAVDGCDPPQQSEQGVRVAWTGLYGKLTRYRACAHVFNLPTDGF